MAQDLAQNGVPGPPPFKWTGQKRRAVELLAADELTDAQVASDVGTGHRTVQHWKAHPEFAAAVQEAAAALGEVARRYAIGRRAARVRALDGRWQDLDSCRRRVLEALDPADAGEPGPPDPAMLSHARELSREMREHEKQAAQELGQWSDKHEVTGKDGTPLLPSWEELARMPREDLLRLYDERRRLNGRAAQP